MKELSINEVTLVSGGDDDEVFVAAFDILYNLTINLWLDHFVNPRPASAYVPGLLTGVGVGGISFGFALLI